jgi:cell division protein FtsZ
VTTISSIIQEAAGDEAEIIFGAVHDSSMKEEVRVTVIACGFEKVEPLAERHDNIIRPDFRAGRAEARPLHGSRTVLPTAAEGAGPGPGHAPPPARTEPAQPHSTPVHKFPVPPRPVEQPRSAPSDLEIPTFIRRQMD